MSWIPFAHAHNKTTGLARLSNGMVVVATKPHPYSIVVRFDFGDLDFSFTIPALRPEDENADTQPDHPVSWAALPKEGRHSVHTCPVNTLGVVERRDGLFHVGIIHNNRVTASSGFEACGHAASIFFPTNGSELADDAPVAWYPLPA